jgi:hypothetical protein
MRGMPKHTIAPTHPLAKVPDVCDVCGQTIDKRSAASMAHHATPKHLPFTGKRNRVGWR